MQTGQAWVAGVEPQQSGAGSNGLKLSDEIVWTKKPWLLLSTGECEIGEMELERFHQCD